MAKVRGTFVYEFDSEPWGYPSTLQGVNEMLSVEIGHFGINHNSVRRQIEDAVEKEFVSVNYEIVE